MDDMIKCPWCAEPIQTEAKKCKHCGEFLTDDRPAASPPPPPLPPPPPPVVIAAPLQQTQAAIPKGDQGILCPHCQVRGRVKTKPVKLKKGLSGGKATAAVFTAGLSIIGTGLSRKEKHLEAHCGNCGVTWII